MEKDSIFTGYRKAGSITCNHRRDYYRRHGSIHEQGDSTRCTWCASGACGEGRRSIDSEDENWDSQCGFKKKGSTRKKARLGGGNTS